jgi:hypothetical protein
MEILSQLKSIITHEPYSCNKCNYSPEKPKKEFDINPERNKTYSDFNYYDCPQCNHVFQAIFCDCGRGYTCRADFNRVSSTRHGEQETYKCDCGNVLHTHQRH